VTQILAGTNVTVSPAGGTGNVTVNSTASGGVTDVTSAGTITVTNPTGPTTNVDVVLDSTAGDIQAVGSSASAGASGKVPDASHVHQGVTSITAGTNITVTGGDGSGHGALTVAASGGGSANAIVVRKFAWTHSTSGLFTPSTGWSFYTGTTGDLLHDVILEVDTIASSTAIFDLGTYTAGQVTGFFKRYGIGGASFGMPSLSNAADVWSTDSSTLTGMVTSSFTSSGGPKVLSAAAAQGAAYNFSVGASSGYQNAPPFKWTANQPLIACITQTGLFNGATVTTPGSAAGTIYLLTSTPA
jgi:hypothetical protein